MKRERLRKIVDEVLQYRMIVGPPVTFDNLTIDFDARRVTFRGRTIQVETDAVTFPVLTTDRMVVVENGEVI